MTFIAMLVGEFTDMGWDKVHAQDWHKSLCSTIAETLEAGVKASTQLSAADAGDQKLSEMITLTPLH
jgi:hypothetical protein